jgi:hypothetical protein
MLYCALQLYKRHKGNNDVAVINFSYGLHISDLKGMAKYINLSHSSVFSCGHSILRILYINSCESFIIKQQ